MTDVGLVWGVAGGEMGGQHMQIGEVAEKTGLSLRTIRHYEEVGLAPPSARSQGGFRLYTDDDLARLLVAKRMKPLGFTLEEIRELITILDQLRDQSDHKSHPELVERLTAYQAMVDERCDTLRARLADAEDFSAELADERRRQGGGQTIADQ